MPFAQPWVHKPSSESKITAWYNSVQYKYEVNLLTVTYDTVMTYPPSLDGFYWGFLDYQVGQSAQNVLIKAVKPGLGTQLSRASQ